MNNFFAEFISPKVSKLHQADPTIEYISFNNIKNILKVDDQQILKKIFQKNILYYIYQLSHGNSIDIKADEIEPLQIISILLENKELFNKLNELFVSSEKEGENIDHYIRQLQLCQYFGETANIDYSQIIDHISSEFYSIDTNKLKTLSHSTIHSIISSSKLKLESEDSLLDFIDEIFSSSNNDGSELESIYDFYEEIEFNGLSESKFQEIIERIDPNYMTVKMWRSLKNCFYANYSETKIKKERYTKILNDNSEIKFEGDGLKGIIRQLTIKCSGNVDDKNCVKITSSSVLNNGFQAKNAADLDSNNYFHSASEQYSWIKYDFRDKKVCLTHYTIKNNYDSNSSPKSWVLEGSNNEGDWVELDSQTNNSIFLPNNSVLHTFQIKKTNEYFQYLRIRSTGPNNTNCNYFAIESLEYFGYVKPKI